MQIGNWCTLHAYRSVSIVLKGHETVTTSRPENISEAHQMWSKYIAISAQARHIRRPTTMCITSLVLLVYPPWSDSHMYPGGNTHAAPPYGGRKATPGGAPLEIRRHPDALPFGPPNGRSPPHCGPNPQKAVFQPPWHVPEVYYVMSIWWL